MKRFATPALVILVLLSVASTQAVFDRSVRGFRKDVRKSIIQLNDPLVPSVSVLKALSLGNPSAAADYLWLKSIQYFGTSTPYGKYPTLAPLVDTITQLDPKFEYPYEFAMITLPFMDKSREAAVIGARGAENFPNSGWMNYYLGTVYHLNLKDYKNAFTYYERASKLPDAPGAASSLAGTVLNQITDTVDDRLAAAVFWEAVYEKAKTEEQRETAKNWFLQMQILYTIELNAERYKTQFGSYPETLQDLVTKGYMKEIPASPVDREYVWNASTGKVADLKVVN